MAVFLKLEAEQAQRKNLLIKPHQFYEGLKSQNNPLAPLLYIGRLKGLPIAAVLLIEYASTIEYFTPVVLDEYKHLQPISAIIAQSMQDALQRGIRLWNFGGTHPKLESVKRFKERWGARTETYFYCSMARSSPIDAKDIRQISAQNPYFFVYPY